MAIIPGAYRRMLDVMTTGLSMAKVFYSPSLMSLLEQPIPTREFYAIKPERPSGYSQAHWRKIQKERLKRAAQRPSTISGRRAFLEQYSCDFVDAASYAFEAVEHMKRRTNELIDNALIGSTSCSPELEGPRSLTRADIVRAIRSLPPVPERPKFDLHSSRMIGRPYELPRSIKRWPGCWDVRGVVCWWYLKISCSTGSRSWSRLALMCVSSRASKRRPRKPTLQHPLKLRAAIRLHNVCQAKGRDRCGITILESSLDGVGELDQSSATRQESFSFVGCAHGRGKPRGVWIHLGVRHECCFVRYDLRR